MQIFHWKYVEICQEEYGGAAWIYMRIRHESLYGILYGYRCGSHMGPLMHMCSQLIQNVNMSLDLCTNVLGGLREAAGAS